MALSLSGLSCNSKHLRAYSSNDVKWLRMVSSKSKIPLSCQGSSLGRDAFKSTNVVNSWFSQAVRGALGPEELQN